MFAFTLAFLAFKQLVLLWSCLLKGSNMFVLTNEVLSKKHDEKFGSPQMSQYHDTLCKP
jgi:hydroxylamine reductase (hybrid-cluster protein)